MVVGAAVVGAAVVVGATVVAAAVVGGATVVGGGTVVVGGNVVGAAAAAGRAPDTTASATTCAIFAAPAPLRCRPSLEVRSVAPAVAACQSTTVTLGRPAATSRTIWFAGP